MKTTQRLIHCQPVTTDDEPIMISEWTETTPLVDGDVTLTTAPDIVIESCYGSPEIAGGVAGGGQDATNTLMQGANDIEG